jgi:hypothetical protein
MTVSSLKMAWKTQWALSWILKAPCSTRVWFAPLNTLLCAVVVSSLQGVLSELLRSLVHYKSHAALAGGGMAGGPEQQHMNMDHSRAHSPPLLMRPSSGQQQRLYSAGSPQGSPFVHSSSNTNSRLGSFRGHEADM